MPPTPGWQSVVGTAASPLELKLDVSFDGTEVGVAGLRVDARVAPLADGGPTADVRVGVKLPAAGGGDELTMIDPEHLEDGALAVLAALLQSRLDALAADADATPELTALAHHLLPALGLGGGLPPLPLDRIGEDADLLRVWLAELLDTAVEGRGQAIAVWLEHVGGLFGAGAPAGTGTRGRPVGDPARGARHRRRRSHVRDADRHRRRLASCCSACGSRWIRRSSAHRPPRRCSRCP